MAYELPPGIVVTGLGKAAWLGSDRLVEVVSDGTPLGLQVPPTIAMDLAVQLLMRPTEEEGTTAFAVTELQIAPTPDGGFILYLISGQGRLPLKMPAGAAEALRVALSDNPLKAEGGPKH